MVSNVTLKKVLVSEAILNVTITSSSAALKTGFPLLLGGYTSRRKPQTPVGGLSYQELQHRDEVKVEVGCYR